tara:strand:+ start:1794 stop:3542 length:1749 start_codon:yes stop_codon:yes gene_type:complete
MSLLEVDKLCIGYGNDLAVDKLSFAIEHGESVGLVGESGSGKTQTGLAILGLLPASAALSGHIRVGGTEVVGADERALNALRARRVAMVFQDPLQALNPYVRIGRQLRRILLTHNISTGAAADQRVLEMLDAVGLPDPSRQVRAYPHQLSGGMRQRVMIAAALIAEPELLIADEPTTALDVTVQAQVLELLDDLRRDTALLLITHDLGIVAGHCERMLVLERGRLVESGPTAAVFAAPATEYTRTLLAAVPRLDAPSRPAVATQSQPLVSASGIHVSYKEAGVGRLHAVKSVDLSINAGETLAVVGESGSGKSSLVRALLGLMPANRGTITFDGRTLPPDVQKRTLSARRDLQLVFQDPLASLNPQWRVADIVAEPLTVHEAELSRTQRLDRVVKTLSQVGLSDAFLERYPHELSGGQAQRVAIARALVLEPRVLVCDEAVAALDGSVRRQILDVLGEIQQRTGLSILFISHDLAVVRAISHRVMVMYLGRVVELAPTDEVYRAPRHPYTRALLDAVPVADPNALRARSSVRGEVPSILHPPGGCPFHPRCAFAEDRCTIETQSLRKLGNSEVACWRSEAVL